MAIIELPVTGLSPSYKFRITLEGVVYTLRFKWNQRKELWVFDIANEQDENILVGVPVLTNVNIVGGICKLDMPPGLFTAIDETGQARDPDRETFGTEVKFVYEESA